MVLPFWKLRVENLTTEDGQGSDGLPTNNFESGSDDGRMIFSDGDVTFTLLIMVIHFQA
jgi:hypothetical protein